MTLVEAILSGDNIVARELLEERIEEILEQKLNALRDKILEDIFENTSTLSEFKNVQKTGRTKIIRVRVRGGKVQRRKKVSSVPGFTYRNGKLVRMSPLEKRHRKMGARKAKLKRRGKLSTILRKRKVSLRKRKAMGL
jgi:hypothetical protein